MHFIAHRTVNDRGSYHEIVNSQLPRVCEQLVSPVHTMRRRYRNLTSAPASGALLVFTANLDTARTCAIQDTYIVKRVY